MANIELLISRYLDGELTPAEDAYLRRLLAESPDARATMREMTEVARAARRIPKMHAPQGALEAKLFARLNAEGLHKAPAQAPAHTAAPASAWSFIGMHRGMAVAGLLLLVLLIGGAYLGFGDGRSAARAPIAAGVTIRNIPAPRMDDGGAGMIAEADHGGMVNIPEVRLVATGARRSSHTGAVAARAVRRDAVELVPERAADTLRHDGAPLVVANRTPLMVDTVATATQSQAPQIAPSIVPPAVVPGEHNHWAASFRGGVATVNDETGTKVRELDMKIGLQMVGGHKVSFIVGMAPAISETHRENTGIGLSSPGLSQVPPDPAAPGLDRSLAAPVAEFERVVRSEPWFGVGYNYSVPLVKDLSVDPGVKAGASVSTWRMGAELPVSYRMSKNMSIECAVAVSHILPRNASIDSGALTDTPDHFIYEESKQAKSFTTFGVQLGIRLEIPAGK